MTNLDPTRWLRSIKSHLVQRKLQRLLAQGYHYAQIACTNRAVSLRRHIDSSRLTGVLCEEVLVVTESLVSKLVDRIFQDRT